VSFVERNMQRSAAVSVPEPRIGLQSVALGREPEMLEYDREVGAASGFSLAAVDAVQLTFQMRTLKRRVLDSLRNKRATGQAPIILITSAAPGDGKSFISFHLANALTKEPQTETVLIDADVARQRISGLFDATAAPGGLAGCLTQEAPLAKAIRRTSIPNLAFVPAGRHSANVAECLASRRWDDIATEMRGYGSSRLFVVDTAPVLASSETEYLARSADLVLFVIRAEVTPQPIVDEALARLGDLSRVAFVFNGYVSTAIDAHYDYSAYGVRGDENSAVHGK
jgi:Mrp family chromosome partitioning ATPase